MSKFLDQVGTGILILAMGLVAPLMTLAMVGGLA